MPLLMEAVLARYLSVPAVCDFLLRRVPEGYLSNPTLESCITFSYAGDKSSPQVEVPIVRDSYVVQSVVCGVALGEVLACSFVHPLLPTLNSVAGSSDEVSTSPVTSRRFAADLLAPNKVEVLEFAWLEDLRLIVSFRWTRLAEDAPFLIEGETRLYPQSMPGEELTMLWDVPLIRLCILVAQVTPWTVPVTPVSCPGAPSRGLALTFSTAAMRRRSHRRFRRAPRQRRSWSRGLR
jgi:hypothetical protein